MPCFSTKVTINLTVLPQVYHGVSFLLELNSGHPVAHPPQKEIIKHVRWVDFMIFSNEGVSARYPSV